MKRKTKKIEYDFFKVEPEAVLTKIGRDGAHSILEDMITIRTFELRGEQAYQTGKAWGFYHSYSGQEAIQTSAVHSLGKNSQLWITTYRCHALALLLGMTPDAGMSELYGKANGNAGGRGGSMHMYAKNMYGGAGIVGGQWPIATGLALSIKYRGEKDKVALCFGGEGSVFQGTFHESANLAALWNLPLMIVIENNRMGMGTQVERAVAKQPIGENVSKAYGIKSFTFDGMDVCAGYATFKAAYEYVIEKQEPVIIEAVAFRFRGHSISDSANYRTKEELQKIMERDPINIFKDRMKKAGFITDEEFKGIKTRIGDEMVEVMKRADAAPNPDVSTLEDGVYVDP